METVLYADILFLIDFSMDYLSLYAAARLLSLRTSIWRTVIAAALGGLYGIAAVLFGLDGLPGTLCAVGVSVLLSLIAFGKSGGRRDLMRASVTVWGCGALLGGVMTAFSSLFGTAIVQGGGDILCAGAAVFFAFVRFSKRKFARGTAEIKLTRGERVWQGSALIDSGNLLTDPIGGYAVILLRVKEARELLGEDADTLYKGDISKIGVGVRAVPMRTADGTRLLYGFLCRDVGICRGHRRQMRTAVVCVDHAAAESGYGGCAALLPASLVL